MIRFIHCADLHLGRTFQTSADMSEAFIHQAVQSSYRSFEAIIQEAISRNVDFVVISGDVYDQKKRSVRAQWFVKKQAEKLLNHHIPLFIIHGNHDPEVGGHDLIDMPENVHIFPTEVTHKELKTLQGEKVILYGFSYPQSAYTENPVPAYHKVKDELAFHIALLHGQEKGQVGHDPYAPFTLSSLEEKEFDYWALGHIHKRQLLKENPPIVYPGNIQGCHRKETGGKGAYFVELTHSEVRLQFIETAPVRWEQVSISISELHTIDELLDEYHEQIEMMSPSYNWIVMLTIKGQGILHEKLADKKVLDELFHLMEEDIGGEHLWIDRMEIHTQPELDRDAWRIQDHLLGDVVRLRDELEADGMLKEVVSPLFEHRKIRKYINEMDEEEWKQVIESAEGMILTSLLDEGRDEG
ncbi:metallophosphoesterase family protein [Salipaludibacillus keqinensis]|nr:DNA repair exonuclease [Salipaludibacillus keqinensis]